MSVRAGATVAFRNRIIEYGVKPADQFLAHPDNPKFHPQFQRDVMSAALTEVGFVAPVIESRSGYLLDGHERVWTALANDNADVPFVVVDVEPGEESYVLATFDPIGRLSMHDAGQIDALLQTVQTDDANVQALLDALKSEAIGTDTSVGELTRADVPDAIFASDNEWGIPLLDSRLQAEALAAPVTKWGSVARTSRMAGTWHFYTDDYKFEALWDDPSPVVNTRCAAVIEPNYSQNPNMPRAVVLWHIYRKRWLARWWQSKGVRVLVDLNVERAFFEFALMGVPQGWTAYANRAYEGDLAHLDDAYALAQDHAGDATLLYVVIGGRTETKALCRERGWLWIAEDSARARKEAVADG